MEFEYLDLDSVLEQPTRMRTENAVPVAEIPSFPGLEFEEDPISIDHEEEEEEEEDILPYNAEEAAENLVSLLASANYLLTPLAVWKLKKKRGGKRAIQRMQANYFKNLGKPTDNLTEQDKNSLALYQAYLKDKEELERAMPFSDDEIEQLTKLAIPYCRSTKLKIAGGLGFWGVYGTMQFQRVMAIISA